MNNQQQEPQAPHSLDITAPSNQPGSQEQQPQQPSSSPADNTPQEPQQSNNPPQVSPEEELPKQTSTPTEATPTSPSSPEKPKTPQPPSFLGSAKLETLEDAIACIKGLITIVDHLYETKQKRLTTHESVDKSNRLDRVFKHNSITLIEAGKEFKDINIDRYFNAKPKPTSRKS